MNDRLDEQLRKALRPLDPREGFAERVIARIEEKSTTVSDLETYRPRSKRSLTRWLPMALAASAVLGIALAQLSAQRLQAEQEERGLEARRQLMEALRVTSDKLDAVYQAVHDKPPPARVEATGV
jgi:hypothetical protein